MTKFSTPQSGRGNIMCIEIMINKEQKISQNILAALAA